jgi:hypothetical protein
MSSYTTAGCCSCILWPRIGLSSIEWCPFTPLSDCVLNPSLWSFRGTKEQYSDCLNIQSNILMCFGHGSYCHGVQKPLQQLVKADFECTLSACSNYRILTASSLLYHNVPQQLHLCQACMPPIDYVWYVGILEILLRLLYEDLTMHSLQLVTPLLHCLFNKWGHIIIHIINLFQQVAILLGIVCLPRHIGNHQSCWKFKRSRCSLHQSPQ